MQFRNGTWVRVNAAPASADDKGQLMSIFAAQRIAPTVAELFLEKLKNGCTAIYLHASENTPEEVHIVDEPEGQTLFRLPLSVVGGVRQAKNPEIPAKRRPDDLTAKKLGYL